jgi:hypothetical protein
MTVRTTRIGFVTLVATILTVGICAEAVAKTGRDGESAKRLQLASQQPAQLGPMRYYGGPKSPMWREVK